MIDGDASAPPSTEYSPQHRTALVLAGTGTAGAYHAGVLRALHEAGVKIDIVAARGVGVIGALFAAIDGSQRLWDEHGFWRSPAVAGFYRWHPLVRAAAWTIAAAVAIVLVPLGVAAAGAVVFPVDFALRMVGIGGAAGLTGGYLSLMQRAFGPEGLPTWLPRLVVVVLSLFALALAVRAIVQARHARRARGGWLWRLLPPPLGAADVTNHAWRVMWELVRGATQLRQPPTRDLARRYVELLGENLGQPGFRELAIVVHDLDARRDLLLAFVAESRRRDLVRRATVVEAEERRASVLDFHGVAREHLADGVAAALSLPLMTEPQPLTFAADAYWRGETHRLCDRPAALARLFEELESLGVEQAIVVSASGVSPGPHALRAARIDGRGRFGEAIEAAEAAALRDGLLAGAAAGLKLFTIQPAHQAVGPLDFAGGYDDRSDRRQPLSELMSQGYEDAYHQFVEPVVGGSGEHVGQEVS